MKSPSRIARLVLAICFLAVASAQVFGAGRAFLCRCSGDTLVTQADHCEGEHDGVTCQRFSEDGSHRHERGEGDVEHHEAVEKSMDALQQAAKAPTPAIVPVVVAVLPVDEPAVRAEWSALARESACAGPPPPAVAVARTVVLRI